MGERGREPPRLAQLQKTLHSTEILRFHKAGPSQVKRSSQRVLRSTSRWGLGGCERKNVQVTVERPSPKMLISSLLKFRQVPRQASGLQEPLDEFPMPPHAYVLLLSTLPQFWEQRDLWLSTPCKKKMKCDAQFQRSPLPCAGLTRNANSWGGELWFWLTAAELTNNNIWKTGSLREAGERTDSPFRLPGKMTGSLYMNAFSFQTKFACTCC